MAFTIGLEFDEHNFSNVSKQFNNHQTVAPALQPDTSDAISCIKRWLVSTHSNRLPVLPTFPVSAAAVIWQHIRKQKGATGPAELNLVHRLLQKFSVLSSQVSVVLDTAALQRQLQDNHSENGLADEGEQLQADQQKAAADAGKMMMFFIAHLLLASSASQDSKTSKDANAKQQNQAKGLMPVSWLDVQMAGIKCMRKLGALVWSGRMELSSKAETRTAHELAYRVMVQQGLHLSKLAASQNRVMNGVMQELAGMIASWSLQPTHGYTTTTGGQMTLISLIQDLIRGSADKTSHIVHLLAAAISAAVALQPESGIQSMLQLVIHAKQCLSQAASISGASTGSSAGLLPAEADAVVQAACAAALQMNDATTAAVLLQAFLPVLSSPRAQLRKLLLDLAECTIRGNASCQGLGLQLLVQACHDKDATVRAKALACLSASLPDIWPLLAHQLDHGGHDGRSSNDMLSMIKGRLMDKTKTVRSKALLLLIEVLNLSADHDTMAAALAAMQKRFVQACLPELCSLLDARQDSQLYDEGCMEMASNLMQQASTLLSQQAFLQAVLGSASPWHGAASSSTAFMSVDAQRKLIAGMVISDVKSLYETWKQHVSSLQHPSQAAGIVTLVHGSSQQQLMRQHAFKELCSILAQDEGKAPDDHSKGILDLLKVVCSFPPVQCSPALAGELAILIDIIHAVQSTAMLPDPVCNRATHGSGSEHEGNSNKRPDRGDVGYTDQQAVLEENCYKMIGKTNALTLDEQDATDANCGHSAIDQKAGAIERCRQVVVWCLAAIEHLLLETIADPTHQNTVEESDRQRRALQQSSHNGHGSSPSHPAGTIRAHPADNTHSGSNNDNGLQPQGAGGLQQSPHHRQLQAMLLIFFANFLSEWSSGPLAVMDAVYRVLCQCPGASRHVHQELHSLEEQLRQDTGITEIGTALSAGMSRMPAIGLCAQYLLLLQHMTSFYEREVADFMHRLKVAGENRKHSGTHATSIPDAAPAKDTKARVEDYMAAEEHNLQLDASAQQFLDSLMDGSSPARQLPMLLSMLADEAVPVQLRVLALRVIGRLMCLSDSTAAKHTNVITQLLHHYETQSHAQLAAEAVEIAERMVLCNPNTNSGLFSALEVLLSQLLAMEGDVHPHQQSLVEAAILSFCSILASEKLKLSDSTYGVMCCCLFAKSTHVKDMVLQLLESLASHSSKKRYSLTLSIFHQTPPDLQLQLVDDVLLQLLLSENDLEADELTLPIMQVLCSGGSRSTRLGAGRLLSGMTPSLKALNSMASLLQTPSVQQVLTSCPTSLSSVAAFVSNYKLGSEAQKDGAAGDGAVTVAPGSRKAGKSSTGTAAEQAPSMWARSGKDAQARLAGLLANLAKQSENQKTTKRKAGNEASDHARAPDLENYQAALSAFKQHAAQPAVSVKSRTGNVTTDVKHGATAIVQECQQGREASCVQKSQHSVLPAATKQASRVKDNRKTKGK